MSSQRILLISPELPPKVGGVGQSALRLASGFAKAGLDVTMLTPLRGGDLLAPPRVEVDSESFPFDIVRVGPMRKSGQQTAKTFRSQLQRMFLETAIEHLKGTFQPDVVLTLTVNVTGFMGSCIATALGVPHIASARGLDIGSGIFRPDFLPFTKMVFERSAAVTFVNNYLMRTAEMVFGPRPEFRVIHNGIQPMPPSLLERKASLRSDLLARLGISEDGGVVGYSGTFRAKKGIRCLHDAFHLLAERRPSTRLLIVGGPRYENERALAGTFFEGGPMSWGVVSTGLLDNREDVLSFYAAMDCAVVPSIEDGLPNAMLEAMAMGVPVVATDIFDDVIQHDQSGLIVPRHDASGLAAACARILDDPVLAQRLAAGSLAAVTNEFAAANEIRAYLALIHEIVDGSKLRHAQ